MSKVNLDAIIPREDFIAHGDNDSKQSNFQKIILPHLLPSNVNNYSSIHHLLKKPDFQRETNEWDKKRIATLIESFIDGSFIPSIILWENSESGNIYVIDGAHRLSAILAYINDDYGDKEISHSFYGYNKIPEAEIELAKSTREYINKTIGSFKQIIEENSTKANGIKKNSFDVQWIQGDVKKAEDSFFKINQQGVILSPIERQLCKSREKPTCIATRAVIKGGAGTQYWKNFSAGNQSKIKSIAEELNELLFKPPYSEDVQSVILHHPLGGSITNATPMIFDLMKIIKSSEKNDVESDDIVSGDETLDYLNRARKVIWRALSNEDGSLGLHPSIYFYNGTGKFIQSTFLGMMQLLIENKNDKNFFFKFTKVRRKLEDFLLNNKILLTQLNRTYGSKERSYRHIKGFFQNVIELLNQNFQDDELLNKLKTKENVFNEKEQETGRLKGDRFTKELKTLESIKREILSTQKCYICGGYVHPLSKSFDHKNDRKYGGSSDSENLEITHVYCNNSKDKLIELKILTK